MKIFVCSCFCLFSFSMFSSNLLEKKHVEVYDILVKEITLNTIDEKEVVFECYHTVKWLYKEFPFLKKLDALA